MSSRKLKITAMSVCCLLFLSAGVIAFQFWQSQEKPSRIVASNVLPATILYQEHVQRIFNQRCVVCHSCNNAPCQLNLTSFEGLQRGMSKQLVYEPDRKKSARLTRLGQDYTSETEWRNVGFFSVQDGLLRNVLVQKMSHAKSQARTSLDPLAVLNSHSCPSLPEIISFYEERPHAGMPYNLPALPQSEFALLQRWIQEGMPGPAPAKIPISPEELKNQQAWENFLNDSESKTKLVARYLYEHLFLAHVHFSSAPQIFFRLIRSRSKCQTGIAEIASRRPIDDPGQEFYYCFKPIQQKIVEKTHMPYLLDADKLAWIKNNFFVSNWNIAKLPSYEERLAANPFKVFAAIPAQARYRFLLQDAHYHISTFIKGPVCNGNGAVGSIDDQFYVFFMQPEADLLSLDSQFALQSQDLLDLPAEMGSDAPLPEVVGYFTKYPKLRNKYRRKREEALARNFPQGLGLEQIWNGDGKNANAMLTVFRHSEHASVVQGAMGDASRSAFVLDYALFERLVYNLVVGFDVYGNLTHQLHTRAYMEMIRMEGESNFLDFLPLNYRELLRQYWYPSGIGNLEKVYIEGTPLKLHTSKIALPANLSAHEAKKSLYEKFLKHRLSHILQQFPDPMNWQTLFSSARDEQLLREAPAEIKNLRRLSKSSDAQENNPAQFFPDSSLLLLKSGNTVTAVYTLIRNKFFKTAGSIFFEKILHQKQKDNLTILKGLVTSYPNYFFIVQEAQLAEFVRSVESLREEKSWEAIKSQWGLARTAPNFWEESDLLQDFLQKTSGVQAGVVDYTRYDVWPE